MLVFILVAACAGGKSDTGVDVSGLLCAGTEDPDGNVLVPTLSTDGCTGADVSGQLTVDGCPTCVITEGGTIQLSVLYDHTRFFVPCATGPVARDGTFAFDAVAPYIGYSVDFRGRVGDGTTRSGSFVFSVCSDDVFVEGALYDDTIY